MLRRTMGNCCLLLRGESQEAAPAGRLVLGSEAGVAWRKSHPAGRKAGVVQRGAVAVGCCRALKLVEASWRDNSYRACFGERVAPLLTAKVVAYVAQVEGGPIAGGEG